MIRTIGIAIATYERPDSTFAAFKDIHDDPRISHVALSDDASNWESYQKLVAYAWPKVSLARDDSNLGSWLNKRRAVELCKSEWVALIDPDNIVGFEYLDALWSLQTWNPDVLYLPVRGVPALDYQKYSGMLFDRNNIASHLHDHLFQMLINTGNFFVNRANHLIVSSGDIEESYASDGIYFIYRWLESGRGIYVMPNLSYQHSVHNGHWTQTAAQSLAFANKLTQRMMEWRCAA